jgi:tetratricopeptide (TPR) repeat protein
LKGKYNIIVALVIFTCFCFYSCSTTKNKWINRQYHAVVAHYNAWWNGNESLKEGKRTIEKNYKDDYTKILPIFISGNSEQVAAIKTNTDRAIEKGSKVIKKHSMRFSGRERNPQVDDAYLLIGKACYYSNDYKTAEATFKYIISGWKNQKEMYEPMIWLGLTYTKQKKYSESESVLNQVKKALDEKKAPKKLNNFLYLVMAENNIRQGKTYVGLDNLSKRRFTFFQRSLNTRLKFIEGQIYQQTKDYAKANKCFKYSANHAKDYSMQFVSKLNMALCYDPKTKSSIPIINKLEKMLDDKKNTDYKDQIYYAIGEVYFRDRNMDIACKKWEESVSASTTNTVQKIASSLRAANVYYDTLENYEKAQMYYDTALTLMPKDYPNRANIESRQKVLTSLVENLRIINRWDSLIAMSNMSKEELDAKIQKSIAQYKQQQKEKEEQERIQQAILARNASMNTFGDNLNSRSNWYFYNPATVQAGKLEFKRRWGDRALEDDWRLKDKSVVGFDSDTTSDTTRNETDSINNEQNDKNKDLTPDKPEYYTKDIPYTEKEKQKANNDIANALLDAGYIYYQGLNNNGKAIETFLDLHKRYPTHKNILPSSYHLYKIYLSIGQYPNANFYKNKILNEYPESEFAMMIKNPDYWENVANNNTTGEQLYSSAYNNYANNEFNSAINKCNLAVDSLKIGPYIPRLLYVKALSLGKLYGVDSLSNNLNMIIYNYPNSEVTPIIEKQLKYLSENYKLGDFDIKYRGKSNKTTSLDTTQTLTQVDSIKQSIIDSTQTVNKDDILDAESLVYRYKDMNHYYIMLADDSKNDVQYVQKLIDDFNQKNYPEFNLKSTAQLFTFSDQMINVRKFNNIEQAMEYYNKINNDSIFKTLNPTYYKHFIISIQNYPTFYNKRNIEAYMKFFRIMYLQNNEKQTKKE